MKGFPPAAVHPCGPPVASVDDVGGLSMKVQPAFGGLEVGKVLIVIACVNQQLALQSRVGDRRR